MSATARRGMYFDPDGNELSSTEEWCAFLGEDRWRQVTVFGEGEDEITVSTVYLGLNHRFGDGPPLIFETMIFGGDYDERMWRWSSKESAERNHAMICLALEKGEPVSRVPWD